MVIITPKGAAKIKEIWEESHSLPKVCTKTRLTPRTVREYINVPEPVRTKFEGNIPDFDYVLFRANDWDSFSFLSTEESQDLALVREELDI